MAQLLVPRDHIKGHPARESAYLAIAATLAARSGREVIEDERELEAYVTMGMWVADCPQCNNGIAVNPEWSVAACLGIGCYRIFRRVRVPAEWAEIEGLLVVRPRVRQAWLSSGVRTRVSGSRVALPDETVEELTAENLERGLPVKQGAR